MDRVYRYLPKQRVLWKVKVSVGDAVHKVERNPLHPVTVEHDKVVFEDQECVVCYQNKTLFFIIPMIHPEKKTSERVIHWL